MREPDVSSTLCASATAEELPRPLDAVRARGQIAFPGRRADVDPVDQDAERLVAARVHDDVGLRRRGVELHVDDGRAVRGHSGVAREGAEAGLGDAHFVRALGDAHEGRATGETPIGAPSRSTCAPGSATRMLIHPVLAASSLRRLVTSACSSGASLDP